MPYLSKKRVWTQQPQQHSLIVDPYWLSRGLYSANVAGLGDILAPPKPLPTDSAITVCAKGKLVSQATPGSSSSGIYCPKRLLTERTILFTQYCTSRKLYGNWLSIGIDRWRGEYSDTELGWIIHGAGWNDSATVFSGDAPYSLVGRNSCIAGVWGKSISGGAGRVFVDGLEIAGSGSSYADNCDRTNSSAISDGGASQQVSGIGLYYEFDKALSADEVKILSDNPWQIFKKQDKRIWVPSAGGGSSTNLIIQDSTHSLLSDNLDLSTSLLLTIQDSTHSLTSDNLTLGITGSTDLIIQEATHSVTSDNLLITTEWLLDIASAAHALTSDNLDLSTALSIIIQKAVHSHTADNLVLDTSGTTLLTIQDAVHNHTADNLGLTLDTWLVIADAVHSHLADNIGLGTELTLTIQDSTHNLTSDIIILSIPSVGSCPTVEEIVAAIMLQIEAKNYLTLPQFLSFK